MTINRILWPDLDGHDVWASDLRFMSEEFESQIENRFRAVTYKEGADSHGIAHGLQVGAINDIVVVAKGVAYDNVQRTRIELNEAVLLDIVVADIGKFVVIEAELIDDDPVAMRMEAHPEKGVSAPGRQVYRPLVSIVAVPDSDTQIKLGLIESYTPGSPPVLNTQIPNRVNMILGTAEGQLTANTVVVVALDGSGDFTDIQSAIDSLPNTGGHIHIKSGSYIVNVLTIKKNGIRIEGSGAATRILVSPPPLSLDPANPTLRPGIAFLIGDDTQLLDDDLHDNAPGGENRTKSCYISHCLFDCVPNDQSPLGSTRDINGNPQSALAENSVDFIQIVNGTRVWITNCYFRDTQKVSPVVTGVRVSDNSTAVFIRRCDFQNLGAHIEGSQGRLTAPNRRVFIAGNTFSGNVKEFGGVAMKNGWSTQEWVLIGNILTGIAKYGFVCDRVAQVVANISYFNLYGLSTGGASNATVKGNVGAIAVANGFVFNTNYGVTLIGAQANMVYGNNLRSNILGGTNPPVADENNIIDKNVE